MKTLLHLQDLQKSFGQQLVLNHVGFELQSGEIIGLIGPSGAGKSTMIKTMLGMEKADSGIALVLENTMPNRHILGDIGYMAQSDALYEALSGQENLEFFGQLKGLSPKDLTTEIAHVAQVVDLTDHLNKAVSGYSGGMKRRLSLAIALLGTWLFKKEAMGGGDVKLMGGIGALIGWEGVITTIVFASFLGLVYAVFLMIFKGKKGGDAIPFGPFLSLGALINLFYLVKPSMLVIEL